MPCAESVELKKKPLNICFIAKILKKTYELKKFTEDWPDETQEAFWTSVDTFVINRNKENSYILPSRIKKDNKKELVLLLHRSNW